MKTVRIKKSDLVATLTTNRAQHRDQFEKAFRGYRDECIRVLTENLEALKTGRRIQVRVYDVMPADQTKDYDTALNMLSMSVDDVIELTYQEFQQYVEDNWRWREDWTNSNMKYLIQK